jgi:hypothetical protein
MNRPTSEDPALIQSFPNLATTESWITSPWDSGYNCIAWAAGDTRHVWWPLPPYAYWPAAAPTALTLDTFIAAFETIGYTVCADASWQEGSEKVALYMSDDGIPTHAARQVSDGRWTSKLGKSYDIEHTLDGLNGAKYGTAAAILSRPMDR